MGGSDEMVRLVEGIGEFIALDTDVGEVETGLGEIGTTDDETPMAVRGNGMAGSLGEETTFPIHEEVAQVGTDSACEGLTLF